MKTLSGFILLLIMLFNLTGISIVFTIQKARLRREMKSQIKRGVPKEDLHRLAFHKNDIGKIDWTEEDEEFRHNGEMYDIVYTTREGDSLYYHCLNDKEERNLFAHLDETVRKKMKEEKRAGKQSGKLIRAITSLVYLPADNQFIFEDRSGHLRHFSWLAADLSAPYLEYITPPPRLS